TQRVVTGGTPGNLKDRIAALQQRATSPQPSSSSSTSSSLSSSFSSPSTASANANAGASGSALRDRIAKFEQKGGLQTREGSAARKRGELYGNRIASVPKPASPPSSLGRLNPNVSPLALSTSLSADADADADASLGNGETGNTSPVRKRCISTSVLDDTASARVRSSIHGATIDEDEGDDAEPQTSPVKSIFAIDDPQDRPPRRNSVSSVNASRGSISLSARSGDAASPSRSPVLAPNSPLPKQGEPVAFEENSGDNASEVFDTPPSCIDNDPASGSALPPEHMSSEAIPPQDNDAVELNASEDPREAPRDPEDDEESAKTPVMSAFALSSIALRNETGPPPANNTQELTVGDEAGHSETPTSSPSPLIATLETGERTFHEPHKYVVVKPSASEDVSVTGVLGGALDVSFHDETNNANEAQNSNGKVPESEVEVESEDISKAKESMDSSRTTTPSNDGSSRRSPPSPLPIAQDGSYVEPSVEPRAAPKSFHAIVFRKTQEPVAALPRVRAPVSTQTVNIARQRAEHGELPTPDSPDLSLLMAQAAQLEQRLMGGDDGEEDAPVPSRAETPDASLQFPRMEALGNASDPPPPLKHWSNSTNSSGPGSVHPQAQNGGQNTSRESWSWASAESSEDSVPVLTPPSPSFDLATPPFFDATRTPDVEEPDEAGSEFGAESRRSFGSVLSSPGRSARKKVQSMSRASHGVLGRMLSRAGRSASTLALPGEYPLPRFSFSC
ncbi:hypothetical protein DFH11DRAFT_1578577, partial [Phellopilus nigrolimitatus]